MAKGVSCNVKEALSRRGFDMGGRPRDSTLDLGTDWWVRAKPTYPLNSRSQVVCRISRVAHSSHIRIITLPLG